MSTNRIELNIPYMANLGGKAIPTQGITIKLDPLTPVKLITDKDGTTTLTVNHHSDITGRDTPNEEKKPCGYLSGVPLDVDIDTVFTKAPVMGSQVCQ